MSIAPQSLLKLARRYKGKLSRCNVYDANVSTLHPVPEKPWEISVVSGAPFSRRLIFVRRKRKVAVLANSMYVNGSVAGSFACRPFSINHQHRGGFRSESAGSIGLAGRDYSVFTENGKLSADHRSLIKQPELLALVKEGDLRDGESLYFTRGEIGFYLRQATTERICGVIERAIDLADTIEVGKSEPNLRRLPTQFHPIIQLVEKWGLDDDLDRTDVLAQTPESVLRLLVESVGPYLKSIDSYLASFRHQQPTEEAAALGKLAEVAVEAKQYLQVRRAK